MINNTLRRCLEGLSNSPFINQRKLLGNSRDRGQDIYALQRACINHRTFIYQISGPNFISVESLRPSLFNKPLLETFERNLTMLAAFQFHDASVLQTPSVVRAVRISLRAMPSPRLRRFDPSSKHVNYGSIHCAHCEVSWPFDATIAFKRCQYSPI